MVARNSQSWETTLAVGGLLRGPKHSYLVSLVRLFGLLASLPVFLAVGAAYLLAGAPCKKRDAVLRNIRVSIPGNDTRHLQTLLGS